MKKATKFKEKTYQLEPTITAWPCAVIYLCIREPGDEDYNMEEKISVATEGMAKDLLEALTGNKKNPGSLSRQYCYFSVGAGTSLVAPHTSLKQAMEDLLEEIGECNDNHGWILEDCDVPDEIREKYGK